MPEVLFRVRFPDGRRRDCYSPSTIVHEHLEAGATYPVDEFLARARRALVAASERVKLRYGFACSRSTDELSLIEMLVEPFRGDASAKVEIESMTGSQAKSHREIRP